VAPQVLEIAVGRQGIAEQARIRWIAAAPLEIAAALTQALAPEPQTAVAQVPMPAHALARPTVAPAPIPWIAAQAPPEPEIAEARPQAIVHHPAHHPRNRAALVHSAALSAVAQPPKPTASAVPPAAPEAEAPADVPAVGALVHAAETGT
jgi:hypothetical protein